MAGALKCALQPCSTVWRGSNTASLAAIFYFKFRANRSCYHRNRRTSHAPHNQLVGFGRRYGRLGVALLSEMVFLEHRCCIRALSLVGRFKRLFAEAVRTLLFLVSLSAALILDKQDAISRQLTELKNRS